jgi:hypothetical protein
VPNSLGETKENNVADVIQRSFLFVKFLEYSTPYNYLKYTIFDLKWNDWIWRETVSEYKGECNGKYNLNKGARRNEWRKKKQHDERSENWKYVSFSQNVT